MIAQNSNLTYYTIVLHNVKLQFFNQCDFLHIFPNSRAYFGDFYQKYLCEVSLLIKSKNTKLLILIISVALIVLLWISLISTNHKKNPAQEIYRLQCKNDTVMLYLGDDIIAVYDNIITDNLPVSDRQALQSGIEFKSLEDAQRAIEDYDG